MKVLLHQQHRKPTRISMAVPLSRPLTFPYSPPSHSLYPLLPLEVGPLYSRWGLADTISSASGVWSAAPTEINFGAF